MKLRMYYDINQQSHIIQTPFEVLRLPDIYFRGVEHKFEPLMESTVEESNNDIFVKGTEYHNPNETGTPPWELQTVTVMFDPKTNEDLNCCWREGDWYPQVEILFEDLRIELVAVIAKAWYTMRDQLKMSFEDFLDKSITL